MLHLLDSFNHTQDVASASWTVPHNLNRPVNCTVQININGVLTPIAPKQIRTVDSNTLSVTFSQPYTGTVRVF